MLIKKKKDEVESLMHRTYILLSRSVLIVSWASFRSFFDRKGMKRREVKFCTNYVEIKIILSAVRAMKRSRMLPIPLGLASLVLRSAFLTGVSLALSFPSGIPLEIKFLKNRTFLCKEQFTTVELH